VFAIQADIAMNVANALEAEFSLTEQESIEAVPTDSPEAYAVYLRAVSQWADTGATYEVLNLFDAAIRLDPDFALAYARRALLYADLLTGNVPEQQAEFERIAQESAERALALDPTLGVAHAVLAFVHQAHWRWDEAEQEFEEALRLSPNDAEILSQYSRTKRFRGEYDEAVDAARRAAELDPQSVLVNYQLGITYRYARNYDAAAESFRAVIEIDPSGGYGHAQRAFTEISRGNWVDAVAELQIAERLYGDDIGSIRIPQLANAYAQMGRRDDVERLFAALEVRAQDSSVNAALWALMYIALEDYDQALEWLEVAVDDQAPDLVTLGDIKGNPFAIPFLDEPRFRALRDRIGT
jgi:tetratricopeptide (TPR) repeat protein